MQLPFSRTKTRCLSRKHSLIRCEEAGVLTEVFPVQINIQKISPAVFRSIIAGKPSRMAGKTCFLVASHTHVRTNRRHGEVPTVW